MKKKIDARNNKIALTQKATCNSISILFYSNTYNNLT